MKITFDHVSFSYEHNLEVLTDLSFTINSDEMTCIIGPNGSGKSTIAKLMMGLLTPDKGQILIDDEPLSEQNINAVRQKMGIIFQNPDNQFVGVTVADDIAFGLENRNIPQDQMIAKINQFATLVGMQDYLEHNPEQLSGGQKQRVAIAGVLAMDPEIIIFDEATSMLDPVATKEIIETMNLLKKQALKTIINITHNIEEVMYSERVVLINQGKMAFSGTPKEILLQDELLKAVGFETIDSVKLIKMLDQKVNKEVIDKLWELTFTM